MTPIPNIVDEITSSQIVELLDNWSKFIKAISEITEIEMLINTIPLYKKKYIFLIIEPHRYSRLNDLYAEYLSVLKKINNLIILKTYEAGESYKKGMRNSKNLVNDLNVLYNQKTKYIDNYSDLFSLLDEYVKNQRDSIIISAGAGEISNQIRFFYDSRK